MGVVERVTELARRCQHDDEDALIDLINASTAMIVHSAKLPLDGNAEASADDILQEVFWAYWRKRHAVIPAAALRWLITTATLTKLDLWQKAYGRRNTRTRYCARYQPLQGWSPDVAEQVVVRVDFGKAVRQLSSKHRDAAAWLAFGYDLKEMVEYLRIPKGTLGNRTFKMRARLHELLA